MKYTDLTEKIAEDFGNIIPYAQLLQPKHFKINPESEEYNPSARQGMFWISNLDEDIFFEKLHYIILDYKKMVKIIISESDNSNKEFSLVEDHGQVMWTTDKTAYIIDENGEQKKASPFVYMFVLLYVQGQFLEAIIKIQPSSMSKFKLFITKLKQQRYLEEKDKGKGQATATHFKVFTLTTSYVKKDGFDYYILNFDLNYKPIKEKYKNLVEEKFIAMFSENTDMFYKNTEIINLEEQLNGEEEF